MRTQRINFRHFSIVLVVLFSINIFQIQLISREFIRFLNFITVLSVFFLSIRYSFVFRKGFFLPIQLIIFSMIFSFFSAHYLWGQSFFDTLKGIIPYMIWIYFFFLVKMKIPIEKIEKIVVIFGVVYLVLYLFQLINYRTIFFGWVSEYGFERGFVRINFPGTGLFLLSVFIALNKISLDVNIKGWIFWAIIGLLVIILQVTRQNIIGIFAIYLIHFLRQKKLSTRILIPSFFGLVIVILFLFDLDIFSRIGFENQQAFKQGENYIRILSGTYFLTEFAQNDFARIFGSGLPYGGKSNYFNLIYQLYQKSFALEDLGLIAIYSMFGIIAVLGYVLIFIKSFTIKLPDRYYYLKYYLWFLIITSLTSYNIYHYNYLIATVFVLYIYQTVFDNEKIILKTSESKNNYDKP